MRNKKSSILQIFQQNKENNGNIIAERHVEMVDIEVIIKQRLEQHQAKQKKLLKNFKEYLRKKKRAEAKNLEQTKLQYVTAFKEKDINTILSCISNLEEDPIISSEDFKRKKNDEKTRPSSLYLSITNKYPVEILLACVNKWPHLLERTYNKGSTAFLTAALNEDYQGMLILKNAGCNILATDSTGSNALHIACINNNLQMVRLLLSYDIDPNITNQIGSTAFIIATFRKNDKILNCLKQHGAEIDICNNNGISPFLMSALYGYETLIDKLKNWGADIHKSNNHNENAAFLAVKHRSYNCIHKLYDFGCDFQKCNKQGVSPVTISAHNQDFNMLKLLNEAGVNIFQKDQNNDDIFSIASQHKDPSFFNKITNNLTKRMELSSKLRDNAKKTKSYTQPIKTSHQENITNTHLNPTSITTIQK